jgi:hypothetical protein
MYLDSVTKKNGFIASTTQKKGGLGEIGPAWKNKILTGLSQGRREFVEN